MITRIRALRAGVLFFVASVVAPAFAQSTLPLPDVDIAASGFVYSLARLPDGGTIVQGHFASIGGEPRPGIARLEADGTLDLDWAPALSVRNDAFAADALGNVYVVEPSGVVKVLTTGQIDAAFATGAGRGAALVAPDGNGHVYIAGDGLADDVDGVRAVGIARLDATTGAVDPLWPRLTLQGQVDALVASGDALYVGGLFDGIGGQPRRNLAKLTGAGSVDSLWAPDPDGRVLALDVGGGSLYVGGEYAAIGGQSFMGLARVALAGTGSADAAWHPTEWAYINDLALDGTGSVYASGAFSVPSGLGGSVGRFSLANGAYDLGWRPVVGEVYAVAADADGIVIGGQFTRVAQSSRFGLAMLDAAGALLPATNTERAAHVRSVARHPDGGTVVGGDFHRVGAFERRHLARIRPDGTVDPDWDPAPNSLVLALATDLSGAVYAGGLFSSVDGRSRDYLARVTNDGELDPDWNPSPDFIVNALERDQDGSVFIGGVFSNVGGLARSRVAKIRPDGIVDPNWNPGINGDVNALELDGRGALYLGGLFTEAGGLARGNLAKLSAGGVGTVDAGWNVPADGRVLALESNGDGAVYVGGFFPAIGGAPCESLARISTAGTLDAWCPFPATAMWSRPLIRTIALDGADRVYAGGGMYDADDGQLRYVARFTAAGAMDGAWKVDADYEISALVRGDGNTLIAGGGFATIGGLARDGLAVLTTDDTIFANGFE